MTLREVPHPPQVIYVVVFVVVAATPTLLMSRGGNYLDVTDFPNYYAAGKLMTSGHGADVYRPEIIGKVEHEYFPRLNSRVLPFLTAPAWLPLWTPLSLLPPVPAYFLWQSLLVLLIFLSSCVLRPLFALEKRTQMRLLAITALSGPCWEAIRIGQVSALLLMALALGGLAGKRGNTLTAAFWQSLLAIKPQLLIPLLCYQLGGGRLKLVGATAFFVVIGVSTSYLIVGLQGMNNFVHVLATPTTPLYMGGTPISQPTLRAQLVRLGLPDADAIVVALAAYTSILILVVWLGRCLVGTAKFVEFGLMSAIPLGLIFGLYLHNYDLLLLAPGFVAANSTRQLVESSRLARGVFLVTVAALMMPIYAILHYGLVQAGFVLNPFFLLILVYEVLLTRLVLLRDSPLGFKGSA